MPGRNRGVFHLSSRRGLSLRIPAGPGGDLKKQAFADIWENSVVFNELRDTNNLQGKCGCCEFRNMSAWVAAHALMPPPATISTRNRSAFTSRRRRA
jgi:MoaA/NifB/PqqE/SkfB family radical SAM enzyme